MTNGREKAAALAIRLAGPRRIGLGCMALTGIYGRLHRDQAVATLHEALDQGITLFDTAALYGEGANEALVGEVVGPQAGTIIVTKFGLFAGRDGGLRRDSSPRAIRKSVEESLRRLGRERIDLLLQHRPDPAVPAEAVADCINALIAEGKVAAFGLSAISARELRAWKSPPALTAVQNELSVVTGSKPNELLATEESELAYMAYSPLGRGLVTGTMPGRDGDLRATMAGFISLEAEVAARITRLRDDAVGRGKALAAHAVAWALNCGSSVIAIPGCRSPAQVREVLSF